ncbi:hypothetical protein DENSPDRAFT_881861 [Dentipellis sp. KUC8613]|nr:hypothetical protein DENSPDRAFT_881861 [Dentipellis sp. KUC8613]
MLTRTLAAAMTLLAIQTLPTFAGPIGRRSPGGVVSDARTSRAELIARHVQGEQRVGAFDKRIGKNSTVAAIPAAAAPPPSLPASKAVLPSASAAAAKGSAALQPPASAAAPKGSAALQPSASAAVPKGGLSASTNATGTVFPTALPSGASIVVPSDFAAFGPESGTGIPLVTTLFSTPAVAFSTIAGSGADAAPAASATGQAQVAGSPVAAGNAVAASPAAATAGAATSKAPATKAVSRRSRRSTTVREVRKRATRMIARENVLDGLD